MTHDVPRGADRSGAHPARLRPARPSRRRAGPDHDPTAPRTREGAAAETGPRAPGPGEPGTRAPGSGPVTVAIERRVAPENVPAVTRWVQAGVNLANRYPGFLGSGWVRASAGSHDWHMLYRFADAATLDAWQTSAERREWLAQGRGLVEETRVEHRTGIEGWFDAPAASPAAAPGADPAPAPPAPPRWKQSVSIWLGFFPVNLAFTLLVGALVPAWDDVPVVPRVLATTLVLTPVMTYLVLPRVTRLLAPWLARPARGGSDGPEVAAARAA
ncbi:antibiotic biosynthesis monooxygenase [Cellulosimicrobium sp. BIT-GX5]|uniref:Antibiotic biosynthesis monooxygenase n=1 Tax=Cellulosimicrobium composti TaxID=2672572 RepID=A0A6N7ZN19_9MICO|nr:antibiotic biosynthesis monooxygenase [Cellulosimicrobium composti]